MRKMTLNQQKFQTALLKKYGGNARNVATNGNLHLIIDFEKIANVQNVDINKKLTHCHVLALTQEFPFARVAKHMAQNKRNLEFAN